MTLHTFGHKLGLDIDELFQQHKILIKSEKKGVKKEVYKCPICKKEIDNLASVETHVANVHASSDVYHC